FRGCRSPAIRRYGARRRKAGSTRRWRRACRKRDAPLKARLRSFSAYRSRSMKISGVDIRPGNIIEYEGGIWRAVKIQHTQPGKDVVMELYDEKPISVQLPDTIEATIVEADAVVKGQTASSSYKPAVLENGVRVMVPPHIAAGTRIVVDVYEQTYVRRAD